jgi:anti-anti-sigma regulatory factor
MARKKANVVAPPETAALPPAAAPEDHVLYLDTMLDIKHIEQTAACVRARLEKPDALTIDLSRVSVVDTAGVQLLVALCNEAPRLGLSLEFRGQSAGLTQALALLGLQDRIRASPSHATP